MVETAAKEPKMANDLNAIGLTGDINIESLGTPLLGNTLLPKEDNIIIIRKGFGRTRILVPLGVAILLEHSTFTERYVLKKKNIN